MTTLSKRTALSCVMRHFSPVGALRRPACFRVRSIIGR